MVKRLTLIALVVGLGLCTQGCVLTAVAGVVGIVQSVVRNARKSEKGVELRDPQRLSAEENYVEARRLCKLRTCLSQASLHLDKAEREWGRDWGYNRELRANELQEIHRMRAEIEAARG